MNLESFPRLIKTTDCMMQRQDQTQLYRGYSGLLKTVRESICTMQTSEGGGRKGEGRRVVFSVLFSFIKIARWSSGTDKFGL